MIAGGLIPTGARGGRPSGSSPALQNALLRELAADVRRGASEIPSATWARMQAAWAPADLERFVGAAGLRPPVSISRAAAAAAASGLVLAGGVAFVPADGRAWTAAAFVIGLACVAATGWRPTRRYAAPPALLALVAASALAVAAPSSGWLIAGRAAQGLTAAMLALACLAILSRRVRASARPPDLALGLLAAGSLTAFAVGAINGRDWGWGSQSTIAAFDVGVILGVLFLQRR